MNNLGKAIINHIKTRAAMGLISNNDMGLIQKMIFYNYITSTYNHDFNNTLITCSNIPTYTFTDCKWHIIHSILQNDTGVHVL